MIFKLVFFNLSCRCVYVHKLDVILRKKSTIKQSIDEIKQIVLLKSSMKKNICLKTKVLCSCVDIWQSLFDHPNIVTDIITGTLHSHLLLIRLVVAKSYIIFIPKKEEKEEEDR